MGNALNTAIDSLNKERLLQEDSIHKYRKIKIESNLNRIFANEQFPEEKLKIISDELLDGFKHQYFIICIIEF